MSVQQPGHFGAEVEKLWIIFSSKMKKKVPQKILSMHVRFQHTDGSPSQKTSNRITQTVVVLCYTVLCHNMQKSPTRASPSFPPFYLNSPNRKYYENLFGRLSCNQIIKRIFHIFSKLHLVRSTVVGIYAVAAYWMNQLHFTTFHYF